MLTWFDKGVRGICVLSVALSTLALAAADDSISPLGLDEALALAAARSQRLVALDAAGTAAREIAVAAAQPADPLLTVGIEKVPIEGADRYDLTHDFMTMRTIGVERELVGSHKRDAQAARYLRTAEAADAEQRVGLTTLQRQTAAAWLERYYREQAVILLAKQRAADDALVMVADLDYRAGKGSQSATLAARTAAARTADELAVAERAVALASTNLERWVGAAATRPLAEPPRMSSLDLTHDALAEELDTHPEIQALSKREAMAAAEVEVARAARAANWTVGVTYGERGSALDDVLSVSASRPLQLRRRYSQDRTLAAALAGAAEARAEREEAVREHLTEVRLLLDTWSSHRERLARYSSMLVPLAGERVSAATTAYGTGTGSLRDVLDARSAALATDIERLAIEAEAAALWAQLRYLVPAPHATRSEE